MCSVKDCLNNSQYILSVVASQHKYFNFCPDHEGILLEKLLGAYLTRQKSERPQKVGPNGPLVVRFPIDEEALVAADAIIIPPEQDWE